MVRRATDGMAMPFQPEHGTGEIFMHAQADCIDQELLAISGGEDQVVMKTQVGRCHDVSPLPG